MVRFSDQATFKIRFIFQPNFDIRDHELVLKRDSLELDFDFKYESQIRETKPITTLSFISKSGIPVSFMPLINFLTMVIQGL